MENDLTPQAAVLTAAFSNPVPVAPTPLAPTAPTAATPASAIPVDAHAHSGLSPTEANTMAGWIKEDLLKGKMTQAEADKAFDDVGTPLDQRGTSPDLRIDEQKLIDQHFPAANPQEFFIRYADPGQPAPPMTPAMREFDHSARAWLSGAEFPRDGGNALVTQIERVAQQTQHMNADELEGYGYSEFAKLEKAYGQTLDEKLRAAAVMIDALDKKQPGLKNLLRSKGIGDNALVVAQLIGQSECWHARRKGR